MQNVNEIAGSPMKDADGDEATMQKQKDALQGRMETGYACGAREKRAQRPCVERERSPDDLSHRYGHAVR